jgi:hypothetical protein
MRHLGNQRPLEAIAIGMDAIDLQMGFPTQDIAPSASILVDPRRGLGDTARQMGDGILDPGGPSRSAQDPPCKALPSERLHRCRVSSECVAAGTEQPTSVSDAVAATATVRPAPHRLDPPLGMPPSLDGVPSSIDQRCIDAVPFRTGRK